MTICQMELALNTPDDSFVEDLTCHTKSDRSCRRRFFLREIWPFNSGRGKYNSEETKIWSAVLGPLLALSCAILLWGISLQSADPRQMNDLGLVSVLPPLIYLSLIILVASFCLAAHQHQTPEVILLLHALALIFVLHATPVLIYGTLRYSWAWKHVGIVDYIQRHHGINPDISILSAYHNWPGFFTLVAFATEIAGLKNPLVVAAWAPVFFNFLYLGALLLLFRTFTSDRRLVWLGVWFFFLSNWVGQDYFSPQALNYFLHLVILGICLRWFSVKTLPLEPTPSRRHWFARAVSLFHHIISLSARDNIPNSNALPLERTGLMAVVILLFAVVASSHQLTPFMTLAAITALVIFRRCSATGLPLLMLVMAVSWIFFGARSFFIGELGSLIESFGRVTDNLDENLIDLSRATAGQRLVAIMGRALSILLWAMALLGGVRRIRRGYLDLQAILLIAAPFGALMGTAYGGEVIFRIYFFALPFAAFFAAALIYPSSASGTSGRTVIWTVLLSSTLLLGFSFAHYGKDQQYHFTKNEVDAARYLYNTAPPGSLLVEGSRSYPAQFRNYEFFTYVPIDREPPESQVNIIDNPVEVLSRWMDNKRYPRAFLIITRSQKADVDALGMMPAGSLDGIEQSLLRSRKFQVTYGNEDAKIFVLTDDVKEAGQ